MRKKKKTELTAKRILEELVAIGFYRVTDYMQVDEKGLTVLPTERLTPEQAAAIAAIETGSGGVKVKFYDKMKALELLGRAMGLFDGEGVETPENNLLDAIVESTAQSLPTEDLPEVVKGEET